MAKVECGKAAWAMRAVSVGTGLISWGCIDMVHSFVDLYSLTSARSVCPLAPPRVISGPWQPSTRIRQQYHYFVVHPVRGVLCDVAYWRYHRCAMARARGPHPVRRPMAAAHVGGSVFARLRFIQGMLSGEQETARWLSDCDGGYWARRESHGAG